MGIETTSAEACYFSKGNVMHPGSAADVAAAEAKARIDIAALHSKHAAAAVTGGAIKRAG